MSSLKKISGSEAVVKCLIAEGVEIIYGYPGGAIMPVYDELHKYEDKIHHVLTRHEQGATHSAQGFARISGKVGVAIATSGPGATNLVTGIAQAKAAFSPLISIAGAISTEHEGKDAFQEVDQQSLFEPITKKTYTVRQTELITETLSKAF